MGPSQRKCDRGALPGHRQARYLRELRLHQQRHRRAEPPVAILGWNGLVNYRSGLRSQVWTLDQGTTYTATITSVMRLFRADVLTEEGLYIELVLAASLVACRSTVGTWFKDTGDVLYVNLGKVVSSTDVVVIRGFHGGTVPDPCGRPLSREPRHRGRDTGALHCDAVATRAIIG